MTNEELNDLKEKQALIEKNKERMKQADNLLGNIDSIIRGIRTMVNAQGLHNVRCSLKPDGSTEIVFFPSLEEWKSFSIMVLNRRLSELNKEFAAL